MELRWNDADRENAGTRRKPRPSVSFSTTILTWTELGSNLALRGEKPATNLTKQQINLQFYTRLFQISRLYSAAGRAGHATVTSIFK
jgi:hypothetical protein